MVSIDQKSYSIQRYVNIKSNEEYKGYVNIKSNEEYKGYENIKNNEVFF